MFHTFQTFLANRAAMLGYPPEEAYRLLNPEVAPQKWSS